MLSKVTALSLADEIDAALDIVYDHVDDALRAGRFEDVSSLLDHVHVEHMNTTVLLGFLSITCPARDLIASRASFVERVLDQLRQSMTTDDVADVMRGLE